MEKETLEMVLKELSAKVLEDMEIDGPLAIEQCNLLTKGEST